MNRSFLFFGVLLVLVGLLIVTGMVGAQAQHEDVFATLEEIANVPTAIEWRGTNLFVLDAWTEIKLTGDWQGAAAGICNGVFHYDTVPATGNLHCTLTFSGTVLGRAGTIRLTVNGTFNDPTWTGQIALAQGTGELEQLAANDLTYTQTGLLGTVAGTVVFPHG